MSFNQVLAHINKLKIWHVYGQISKLPWQSKENTFNYRLPNYTPDYNFFNFLSQDIKVIHEENRTAEKELTDIANELRQAQNIVFLGFGFAKENMDILGLPNILKPDPGIQPNRHIYATTLGLGGKFKKEIQRAFKIANDAIWGNVFEDMNSLQLLKEYVF